MQPLSKAGEFPRTTPSNEQPSTYFKFKSKKRSLVNSKSLQYASCLKYVLKLAIISRYNKKGRRKIILISTSNRYITTAPPNWKRNSCGLCAAAVVCVLEVSEKNPFLKWKSI